MTWARRGPSISSPGGPDVPHSPAIPARSSTAPGPALLGERRTSRREDPAIEGCSSQRRQTGGRRDTHSTGRFPQQRLCDTVAVRRIFRRSQARRSPDRELGLLCDRSAASETRARTFPRHGHLRSPIAGVNEVQPKDGASAPGRSGFCSVRGMRGVARRPRGKEAGDAGGREPAFAARRCSCCGRQVSSGDAQILSGSAPCERGSRVILINSPHVAVASDEGGHRHVPS
ncbi:hypothetical protein AAFF_G00310710 [Aldrovandia affinis]|uniref:Uncharacterized protein n=1 Tax=Aldrovandia affinis TaxID=143900 RepID=A0AAD7R7W2_9TELE|nr:hypothetical protein AAFF_G00310710 [Aldrovandia affinis]